MPLFHRNMPVRSPFSSVLTQRLTAQATPIAAAQIAAGVPPDQAAINAANAVVDATPPRIVQAVAASYPQVMQFRVTRTFMQPGGSYSAKMTFNDHDEAFGYANSMAVTASKTTVTQLTPSGSIDKPPSESVIYEINGALPGPAPITAQREPLTFLPPVDPETAAAEASAMKSCDSFYAQNRAYFEQRGYTSPKWASLSVNQKSEAIRQAISAEAGPTQAIQTTPPEPQYVASRPAETTVIPTPATNEQAAAAMAEVDAFYTQNQGYFEQLGYPVSTWALMSLGQKSDAINKATSGTLPESNPISPGETPVPVTADTVAVTFDLQIEGGNSGSFAKLEDAVAAALAATTPGDRFEVLYNGKTSGLRIRTTTGSVDVPADIDSKVRLLSRDKMAQFVVDAETKTAATGSSMPWWILGGGAAAAIASRFL